MIAKSTVLSSEKIDREDLEFVCDEFEGRDVYDEEPYTAGNYNICGWVEESELTEEGIEVECNIQDEGVIELLDTTDAHIAPMCHVDQSTERIIGIGSVFVTLESSECIGETKIIKDGED